MAEQQLGLFGAAAPEDVRKRIGRISEADINLAQLSPTRAPIAMASQAARDIGTVASESLFGTPEGRKYKAIKSIMNNTKLQADDPQAYYQNLAGAFKDAGMPEQALMALHQSYAMQTQAAKEQIEVGKITAAIQANAVKAQAAKTAEERNRIMEDNYKSLAEYRKKMIEVQKSVQAGRASKNVLYEMTATYIKAHEQTLLTQYNAPSVQKLPPDVQRTLIDLSKPGMMDFVSKALTGGIPQDFMGAYGFGADGTPSDIIDLTSD